MKILKICMLSLLLVLCTVVAAGVIIQINRGGSDADSSTGSSIDAAQPGSDAVIFSGGNIVDVPGRSPDFNYDYLQYPRALVKQSGTDNWLFYPDLPEGTKPGDMVVLNASAFGFIAWEADPDYADVELFGQTFDDGQVFVSFIVPDEQFAIRALYDDLYISGYVPQEHGAFSPMSATTSTIFLRHQDGVVNVNGVDYTTDSNNRVFIPDGMFGAGALGVPYTQSISLSGFNPPAPMPLWNILGNVTGNVLPDGSLTLSPLGTSAASATISGTPGTALDNHWFAIELIPYIVDVPGDPDIPTDDTYKPDFDNPLTYYFSVNILPRPAITARTLPDGMENFEYHLDSPNQPVRIESTGITTDDWTWQIVPGGNPPPGFAPFNVRPAGDYAWIDYFVPSTAGLYDFEIELQYTGNSVNIPPVVDKKSFSIEIWKKPEIAQRELPDGINGYPYKWELRELPLPAIPPPLDPLTIKTNPLIPVPSGVWQWVFRTDISSSGVGMGSSDSTSVEIAGASPVGSYDPYDFTIALVPDNLNMRYEVSGYPGPNPIIKEYSIAEDFSFKIWPEPTWLTEQSDILPTMDWRRLYPNEPEEEPYGAIIEASYPTGMSTLSPTTSWAMRLEGDLPAGASLDASVIGTEEPSPSEGEEIRWDFTPGADKGLLGIYGNPQTATSRDYNFSIFLKAKDDPNPNIDGKEIRTGYFIRVWLRRYLHIDMRADAFVIRKDEEAKVNWTQPGWDNVLVNKSAEDYLDRRAVMPGTYGEIMTRLSPSFVLWEIKGINDSTVPAEFRPTSQTQAINRGIGNQDFWRVDGTHAFVRILMPDTTDGDVFIRGSQVTDPRTLIDPPSQPPATVGVFYNTGSLRIPSTSECSHMQIGIACTCPNSSIQWRDINNVLAGHNLSILNSNNITATIQGTPLVARPAESPPVTFSLTLRGTMVIEHSWPFIIAPKGEPDWGNADGNDRVDLRDLILMMLIEQGMTPPPNFVLENVDYNRNGRVDSFDIAFHRRLFADPDAPRSPPPSPTPTPTPTSTP